MDLKRAMLNDIESAYLLYKYDHLPSIIFHRAFSDFQNPSSPNNPYFKSYLSKKNVKFSKLQFLNQRI